MPYISMTIDSLRHALHKDSWVVLLEDKENHRYLPIYLDKDWADIIARICKSEMGNEIIDSDIESWIKHIRDSGGKVALIIENAGNGGYRARFFGQGDEIECGVGKGLAMAMRAEVGIIAEEEMLDSVGVGKDASILEKGGDATTWFERGRIEGR